MSTSLLDAINPRFGTGRHGNCLIGPSVPFGIVRLGPDISFPQPNSGYRPGKALIGFSHTRLAGTGGAARYGNIRVMPFTGETRRLAGAPWLTFPATGRQWSTPVKEETEAGYYACEFKFGVKAELTATARVGVHRYTFAEGKTPRLLIDFAAVLQAGVAPAGQAPYCEDWEMEARCTGGRVEFAGGNEIFGRADFIGGWGHMKPYAVFFFIRVSRPFAELLVAGEDGLAQGRIFDGPGLRAVLSYADDCRELTMETGISFASVEQARHAVFAESRGDAFEVVRARAREAWRPWMERIEVTGGTDDQRALLATSLYHLFTLPTDLSVDGVKTAAGSPVFTDLTCLWDSIRNANSLCHLIAPEFSADLMNSLLHTADESGWLPDAHIAGHFAYQQSGCCAEILFSEAARKGVPGVDYRKALAACVRNAETPSPAPDYVGRYLDDYEALGYLTTRVPKGCVSRHVEYAFQDWCIARLAEHLGETALAARFDEKAQRLWNLWKVEARAFMPRHPDGSWVEGVDAESHAWDGWNDPYSYESTLRYWSFSGLHDIVGLIARHGGEQAFSEFLHGVSEKPTKIEKETRMHLPHLHQFAGRADRTADWVKRSLETKYLNNADGLPDDEDMGCQSAYYLCNALGLYPLYGTTTYSLVPPVFERSVMHYGNTGKSLTILRKGSGPHITAVRLNGALIGRTLLEHAEIAGGGVLEIETAETP